MIMFLFDTDAADTDRKFELLALDFNLTTFCIPGVHGEKSFFSTFFLSFMKFV